MSRGYPAAGASKPALRAQARPARLPLSFAQERLWFLEQLGTTGSAYNTPTALQVTGTLDLTALERSFAELVRRHESLRTRFVVMDGMPYQVIDSPGRWRLTVCDLCALEPHERQEQLPKLTQQEMQGRFDLARGPLLRVCVLRLSSLEHVLVVTVHHIISDGWSQSLLLRELWVLYQAFLQGLPAPLPELPLHYADYALWQRGWLRGHVLQRQVGYWKERLRGASAALELPTDRLRPTTATHRGAIVSFALSGKLTGSLRGLARAEGATLFMVLLAGFQVLLSRWSGQKDIVVGTPIAGRTHLKTERLVGFFINTLVLRADLSRDPPFRTFLREVRETTLGAYAHQDLPFEKLVEELHPVRDLSRQPVFQVLFGLQSQPRETVVSGLALRSLEREQVSAKFDLALNLFESASGLHGRFQYATDLFDSGTVERLAASFEALLEGVVANAERGCEKIPLLGAAQRQQLLLEWNATAAPYPRDRCLHELFAQQALRTPDAVALVYEEKRLSYGQLEARSNQLAHYLRALGVGPDVIVGLCVPRSLEMVVGLLGILKAGGAYLPLEPHHPAQRLAFMLEDARAPVVVTCGAMFPQVPGFVGTEVCLAREWERIARCGVILGAPDSKVGADNLAYVLYTSGSSGRPKGVMIEHGQVVNYIWGVREALSLDAVNSYLMLQPLSVDSSVTVLYAVLLLGGELHIVSYETSLAPSALAAYGARHQIDCLKIAPPHLQALLDPSQPCAILPGKRLILGGDVSHWEWVERLSAAAGGCRIFNHYGPTEATVGTTTYGMEGGGERGSTGKVPIGRALNNSAVYVLDEHLEPVPIGVVGELYLGGKALARGYLGRAGLTASSFAASPFGRGGERLYRTGDRARFLADGNLEFLGRGDEQIKIRGYRIEPEEISNLLLENSGVRQAVVVAKGRDEGEPCLVAYVVLNGAANTTAVSLRDYLSERLPAHMVPARVMVLESLPRTAHGKLDRKALPSPDWSTEVSRSHVAPSTPAEELLCGIWAEVLKLGRVGVRDDFFELGGHSLLATQVVARVREVFEVELPLRRLFESPTVEGLSQRIEQLQRAGLATALPAPQAQARPARLRLSFAQERLWLLDQLGRAGSAYNMPLALRFEGALNLRALELSFGELIRRHESLRTRFAVLDDVPCQVIDPPGQWSLDVCDLGALEPRARQEELPKLVQQERQRRFDLACDALWRLRVLRLSCQEHVVMLVVHHIVSDGWSQGVLIRELSALYRSFAQGQPSPLAELPIQYADYALWQRDWLQGEELQRQLGYWKEQLAGAPVVLELPSDRSRPGVPGYQGASCTFALPAELTSALKRLARAEGATLYMVLLGGFQVLLSRYSSQSEIVVGSPIAGRRHRRLEGLVGFFLNTLALRTSLSGSPDFREVLRRVKEVTLEAYAHQDIPFEKLVAELQPVRDLSRQPIFQVMFVLQNFPHERLDAAPGLVLERMESRGGSAKFDLTLSMREHATGLSGHFDYATDLFDRERIERLVGHFERLLSGIVADPRTPVGEVPLLSLSERQQQLVQWNATEVPYPDERCIHELFAERVSLTPDAVAVVYEGGRLTYRQLERRAHQLGHYLQGLGVGPEIIVGLCVQSSLELVIGLLGILKAGGAYLPLDPQYPAERLGFMVEDARAAVVLSDAAGELRLGELAGSRKLWRLVRLDEDWEHIAQRSPSTPVVRVDPDNLAYVIYTSGSTGKPKAVAAAHRGMVSRLKARVRLEGLSETEVCCQKTSIGFVDSVLEILDPLVSGRPLVVLGMHCARDPQQLVQRIESEGITRLITVPSLARAMIELPSAPGALRGLRIWTLSGEALRQELLEKLGRRLPECIFVNLYGSSEVGPDASAFVTAGSEVAQVSIGRAIANMQMYVLDERSSPAPIGVAGELYVGGVGLARGYLGRPGLTAERFMANPYGKPGSRLYRMGDRARYRADGNLECLGRLDHQVKIRGYRIELGEIEAALLEHPKVKEAVVVVRESAPGCAQPVELLEKQLVAYLTASESVMAGAQGSAELSVGQLRMELARKLPQYMIPSAFVRVAALPLTPSGKLDRQALPAPADEAYARIAYEVPQGEVEDTIARLWQELLQVERVGRLDDFFALGGHSLLAVQLVSRLRQSLQVELRLPEVFTHTTVQRLSEAVGRASATTLSAIDGVDHSVPLPLSFAQQRLWFLTQCEVGSDAYHIGGATRLLGTLDRVSLRAALSRIVARHESLRTTFQIRDGVPMQVIGPVEERFDLDEQDLRGSPDVERELQGQIAYQHSREFDLRSGPLIRGCLWCLGEQHHALLISMHHMVSDGWSFGLLINELSCLYRAIVQGDSDPLPPLRTQYADYALWQRGWLEGERLQREGQYWKEALDGVPARLELPSDYVRPTTQNHRGASVAVVLDAAVTKGLKELSQCQGTTLFMTLLAGWAALLSRLSGQKEVVIGTPIANRTRREVEPLIGFFVNTQALRIDVSGSPRVSELLARVRERALQAQNHADIPFEQVVELLNPVRSLAYSPVFQVMFAWQSVPRGRLTLPGLRFESIAVAATTAKYDLTLLLREVGEEIVGHLNYATALFEQGTVQRYLGYWRTLLERMVADAEQPVDRLELLGEAERQRLLVEWNATEAD